MDYWVEGRKIRIYGRWTGPAINQTMCNFLDRQQQQQQENDDEWPLDVLFPTHKLVANLSLANSLTTGLSLLASRSSRKTRQLDRPARDGQDGTRPSLMDRQVFFISCGPHWCRPSWPAPSWAIKLSSLVRLSVSEWGAKAVAHFQKWWHQHPKRKRMTTLSLARLPLIGCWTLAGQPTFCWKNLRTTGRRRRDVSQLPVADGSPESGQHATNRAVRLDIILFKTKMDGDGQTFCGRWTRQLFHSCEYK